MSNENATSIWITAIVVVVCTAGLIGGAVYFNGQAPSTAVKATQAAALDVSDHVRGSASSTVTVIEYGDFECPACGQWEPSVEALYAAYGNRVQFMFRNFPFPQHRDARVAAAAAEAAGLQGKYWEMHDLLYKKQSEWTLVAPVDATNQFFKQYATTLGLDVNKFMNDVTLPAIAARVERDVTSGTAAEVDHTPTFFVNNVQIPNPTGYNDFAKVLDAELAKNTK